MNNQEEWINIVDDDEELAKIECIYFVCEK